METITLENFQKKAIELFGNNATNWLYICPACGTKQSINDFIATGMEKEKTFELIGFSCIGRFDPDKGCNWTLGGLLQIHELEIVRKDGSKHKLFKLAAN